MGNFKLLFNMLDSRNSFNFLSKELSKYSEFIAQLDRDVFNFYEAVQRDVVFTSPDREVSSIKCSDNSVFYVFDFNCKTGNIAVYSSEIYFWENPATFKESLSAKYFTVEEGVPLRLHMVFEAKKSRIVIKGDTLEEIYSNMEPSSTKSHLSSILEEDKKDRDPELDRVIVEILKDKVNINCSSIVYELYCFCKLVSSSDINLSFFSNLTNPANQALSSIVDHWDISIRFLHQFCLDNEYISKKKSFDFNDGDYLAWSPDNNTFVMIDQNCGFYFRISETGLISYLLDDTFDILAVDEKIDSGSIVDFRDVFVNIQQGEVVSCMPFFVPIFQLDLSSACNIAFESFGVKPSFPVDIKSFEYNASFSFAKNGLSKIQFLMLSAYSYGENVGHSDPYLFYSKDIASLTVSSDSTTLSIIPALSPFSKLSFKNAPKDWVDAFKTLIEVIDDNNLVVESCITNEGEQSSDVEVIKSIISEYRAKISKAISKVKS